MNRREFLAFSAAIARAQAQTRRESATARATADQTPRVGIVRSDFKGSEDHDGTLIPGLSDPQPVTAELTDAQMEAMVRAAIEIGGRRRGNLASTIGPEDWVVILPGKEADPRVIRTVLAYLAERKRGLRFSIYAQGSASWRGLADKYPQLRFELVDLASEERLELPVHGKLLDRTNKSGTYRIPKTIQQCDRLISVAQLNATGATPSLGIGNYEKLAGPDQPGGRDEALIDLFGYHPADYAVLTGQPNLVIAGANAVAVDAIGAACLGLDPAKIKHLTLAERNGHGPYDLDLIWTRGNSIEEARAALQAR